MILRLLWWPFTNKWSMRHLKKHCFSSASISSVPTLYVNILCCLYMFPSWMTRGDYYQSEAINWVIICFTLIIISGSIASASHRCYSNYYQSKTISWVIICLHRFVYIAHMYSYFIHMAQEWLVCIVILYTWYRSGSYMHLFYIHGTEPVCIVFSRI